MFSFDAFSQSANSGTTDLSLSKFSRRSTLRFRSIELCKSRVVRHLSDEVMLALEYEVDGDLESRTVFVGKALAVGTIFGKYLRLLHSAAVCLGGLLALNFIRKRNLTFSAEDDFTDDDDNDDDRMSDLTA